MMQRLYYIILLLAFISVVSAAENCTYNTICKCPTGLTQGTYCGGDIGCDNTQVYECSPTGDTCQYGYNVNCDQCGALKCPKSVVSASSSPISLKPTTSQIQNPPKPTSVKTGSTSPQPIIMTNFNHIPSTDRPTSTKYKTPTTTSSEDQTPPQKYLFIGIGSGIGGIILASSLIFFGIFFYKKNKLRPIPTPGNADHRKKMKPIPTPGSMRDEI
ncbi:hypothetical protein C2G38_2040178 [Gigaspora rosea]|uniref:EGF-like domain-containing protein n=1 Tax=Gigaspora rosea TaxID=44941 RepID=A0A397V571_9GLOM|nr:hypothetical protein C2G38_2040178 [Gigaspora rosea]